MASNADFLAEERQVDCAAHPDTKAVFFCNQNCKPNHKYYCTICIEDHNHQPIPVAKKSMNVFKEIMDMIEDFQEKYVLVKQKLDHFQNFIAFMRK